jgi:hypothetical protein
VRCGSDCLVDRLDEAVRVASKPTPEPILQIIAGACSRIPLLTLSGKAAAIGQLIKLDAWVDAALTLIELELPGWKLRRLICEDGEWFCSLSRQPNLPATLDDTADGTHEVMSLAILLAFLEAMATVPQSVAAVPAVDPAAARERARYAGQLPQAAGSYRSQRNDPAILYRAKQSRVLGSA